MSGFTQGRKAVTSFDFFEDEFVFLRNCDPPNKQQCLAGLQAGLKTNRILHLHMVDDLHIPDTRRLR